MTRLLLIDDDELIRESYGNILNKAGYQVETASDGSEGLRYLDTQHFDVVVTDIIMPHKDGIEILCELNAKRVDVYVIVISGGGMMSAEKHLKMADTLGADKILLKPVSPSQLLQAVSDCVSAKKLLKRPLK